MDSRQIYEIRNTRYETRNGSAIILAIVLTTLMAILGVLFLFSSRVDSVATSAAGNSEDLKLAVDTVAAHISQKLVLDTPGVDPNGSYYDYPDSSNPWLACLEPYQSGIDYFWRQVSSMYGPAFQNIKADIIPDYQPTIAPGILADADGDGLSDSIWVQVPDKMSAKGKPIYAAIRIIDNCGMLNINTAGKFDPASSVGSTQLDINLMALADLDNTHVPADKEIRLRSYRSGTANSNFYEPNVIWQYGPTFGAYTPFDISDELKLRNRYIINYNKGTSRIESLWTNAFDGQPYVPRDPQNYSVHNPGDWFWIVSNNYPVNCPDPCKYDKRHLATTYNMDRIINPAGQKMVNVNTASQEDILGALTAGLSEVYTGDVNALAGQLTANLMDYRDYDSNVSVVDVNTSLGMSHYYGFETPNIFLSEIAESTIHFSAPDSCEASFAIELFKPYWNDPFPSITDANNSWRLAIIPSGGIATFIPILWSGSQRFQVIAHENALAPVDFAFSDVNGPNDVNQPTDPNAQQATDFAFSGGEYIALQRYVPKINGFITVDYVWVPEPNDASGWLIPVESNAVTQKQFSYQRDIAQGINPHKSLRGRPVGPGLGLWSLDFGQLMLPSLGSPNPWASAEPYTSPFLIQAHPPNKPFTNIGELGQLLRTSAYAITIADRELTTRFNIADANFQNIFKYLTVTDPLTYTGDPTQTRIKGRININTAPWFVLAQLPWLSYHTPNYELARSIVLNRDINGAFKNTGELMRVGVGNNDVNGMGYYENRGAIPANLLTPPDGAGDAFEERDVIFDRISNLVTVRSDVFTAYILVRIGTNGPQKRVIAILDRSGVTPAGGKVKVVAIQQVPDPR